MPASGGRLCRAIIIIIMRKCGQIKKWSKTSSVLSRNKLLKYISLFLSVLIMRKIKYLDPTQTSDVKR